MVVLARYMVLIMFVWMMLAGICLGKEVYLKDGGVIEGQSVWQRGDKVFVKVNRYIIADFNLDEIDLRRTFPKAGSSSHWQHRKVSVRAATATSESAIAPASIVQAPVDATPAPKPAAPPVPASAAISKAPSEPSTIPTAPAESVSSPDKTELERRKQEAVKMMTEAVVKKDSELMKKALEMQKSAIPQQGGAASKNTGIPLYVPLIALVISLLILVAHWIIFVRAGVAGWKCLIPFYNVYILMEISGKPGWWMFLLLVPLVGFVIYLLAMLSLAKKFGRSELFGVGLFLLPMFFFPVLAFGGSQYEG